MEFCTSFTVYKIKVPSDFNSNYETHSVSFMVLWLAKKGK